MPEAERVIPMVFDNDNLHLIRPDRTYRDGDTIYRDVTYTRIPQGGYVTRVVRVILCSRTVA